MNFAMYLVRTVFSLSVCFSLFAVVADVAAEDDSLAHPPLLANISSPRATWDSFMALTNRYMALIKKGGFTYENIDELKSLDNQISICFDLAQVPPSLRDSRSIETAVCIREIVARFEPLPPDYFPDLDGACGAVRNGHPPQWRYRDFAIEIARTDAGVYKDNYQFTLRTIKEAKTTFELLRRLPYVDKSAENFWENYFLTPGPMIPARWVKALPPIAQIDICEQTVWQWVLLLISYPLIIILIYLATLIAKFLTMKFSGRLQQLRWLSIPLATMAAFSFQVSFMEDEVGITGDILWTVKLVQATFYLVSALMIVIILGNLLAEIAMAAKRFQRKGVDSHLIKFGIHIASLGLAIVILIQGLHMMGISLSTLLAGAGITGLAIALAAQETLRNLIGSVMLLLDKPFHVGQVIKVRGHEGAVEEMGLRSSKIRLENGHLVSIPNEDLARADIENIDERRFIHRHERIAVPLDTPLDKVDQALDILRAVLALKPDNAESSFSNSCIHHPDHNEPRVYLERFGKGSLSIVFHYWFHPADKWRFMEHSHWVNREIVRRFKEAGIKFSLE